MKIRADEHVSPMIVRMVRDVAISPPFEFSSIYEAGHRATADTYWITEFAQEGGGAIISADTDFIKKPPQVIAIDQTGLRVIFLPPRFANAAASLQAAHILMWWSRIEEKLKVAKGREFWVPKWNISLDGDLEQRKVDFHAHYKKHKKILRRAPG